MLQATNWFEIWVHVILTKLKNENAMNISVCHRLLSIGLDSNIKREGYSIAY